MDDNTCVYGLFYAPITVFFPSSFLLCVTFVIVIVASENISELWLFRGYSQGCRPKPSSGGSEVHIRLKPRAFAEPKGGSKTCDRSEYHHGIEDLIITVGAGVGTHHTQNSFPVLQVPFVLVARQLRVNSADTGARSTRKVVQQ